MTAQIRLSLLHVLLPLCLCSTPLPAADTLEISVRDAILKGLENNRALKIERLNPKIMKTFESEQRAEFDPVIRGQANNSESESQQLLRYGASITNLTTSQVSGNVAMQETLPTGTKVSIEGTTDLLDSSLYTGDFDSTRVGISITQSLLKGFGTKVNMANLRVAKINTLSSEYELRGYSEELVSRIEATYWDYALARKYIEIYNDSLKLASQQLDETRERIKIGKTASVELSAAEAELASRKEGLINARSQMETTRLQLLRLINPPSASLFETELVLTDHPLLPDTSLDDVRVHVQAALKNRPDLNQARLDLDKGDIEVTKTRNGLLPKLDLFISLGNTGYADSFSGSVRNINGDYSDFITGLQLEYPLGDRESSARYRRARLNLEQAKEALENMTQLVELDVRSAYIETNRSREQMSATAATVKQREEVLRSENEKFRVGKSTSLLVAQAQRDLLGSRIQEVQAIIAHIKSLINLYRMEGSLLHRRGINIAENTSK